MWSELTLYECKYKCWSRGPWLRGGAGCRDNGDITHWCGNPAPGLHQLQQGEGKLSAAWLWCRAGLGRGEHKKVKVWLAAAWAQRPGPGEPSSQAATFHFLLPAPCWSWAVAWSWCQGKECQHARPQLQATLLSTSSASRSGDDSAQSHSLMLCQWPSFLVVCMVPDLQTREMCKYWAATV